VLGGAFHFWGEYGSARFGTCFARYRALRPSETHLGDFGVAKIALPKEVLDSAYKLAPKLKGTLCC